MSGNLKENVIRWMTVVVLMVVIFGGLLAMYPDLRRSQMLKRQNAELQDRIEAKKREIARLVDNQRRFRTDADFVESIARQNHRVFPGEIVFLFDNEKE